MIIDLIFDRKNGVKYSPKQFYNSVVQYGEVGFNIAEALDNGNEQDVKRSLARYVLDNEYSLEVIEYINSVNWLDMPNTVNRGSRVARGRTE